MHMGGCCVEQMVEMKQFNLINDRNFFNCPLLTHFVDRTTFYSRIVGLRSRAGVALKVHPP